MVWDEGLLKMLKAWSRVYRPYKDIMPCHETYQDLPDLGFVVAGQACVARVPLTKHHLET